MHPCMRDEGRSRHMTNQKHNTTQSGSLPGGVDAEALQKLTANQELMDLMANEKLQVHFNGLIDDASRGGRCYWKGRSIPLDTHTHLHTRQEFMKAVMGQDMAAMQRFAADPDVVRMMTRFQELAMEVTSGKTCRVFRKGGGVV